MEENPAEAIPIEVAIKLCNQIRQENRGKWSTAAAWQCRGCVMFSRGDLAKMCLANRPGYRGCSLVNARFVRQTRMVG